MLSLKKKLKLPLKIVFNYFICFTSLIFISSSVLPQKRICEIKFGEKTNEKRLEKKFIKGYMPESIIRKYGFDFFIDNF